MSDTTLTIILAALAPTLVAMGSVVVSVINSVKANRIESKVDGNMTALQNDLKTANDRIEKLLNFYPSKGTMKENGMPHETPAQVEIVNKEPVKVMPVKPNKL